MRGGRFLAEESPDHLLQRYACDSLEDVFLKLSVMQNRGKRRRSSIAQDLVPTNIVNIINTLTMPYIWLDITMTFTLYFPYVQNPALDLSNDDELGEISGEFGDNMSLGVGESSLPPASSELATAPPPPVPEIVELRPRTARERLSLVKSHHVKALIWKNFLWMWRNPA